MTDHWQGRPAPVAAAGQARRDQADVVALARQAADAAALDPQFTRTVGPRISAALAALLRTVEGGMTREQLQAVARVSHTIIAASSEPLYCPDHHLVQHRDRKPPWCRECGRDRFGVAQRELR